MYFQNIKVADPLVKPFLSRNGKKSKKGHFFAKDKCALLKLPKEIDIILGIGHFYETPIFFITSLYPIGEIDSLRSMLLIPRKFL